MHEKALQRVDVLHIILNHPHQFSKGTREQALRELRQLEKQLSLEPYSIKG